MFRRRGLFTIAVAAALSAMISVTSASSNSDNVSIHFGSPEMAQAVDDAQATLPRVLQLVEKTEGQYSKSLMLKVRFKVSAGHESIWVGNIQRAGETFAGQLANEPKFMPGLEALSDVTFALEDIIDWTMPSDDGRYWGHFTTRVLAHEATGDHRASLLSVLTPTPVPSHW